MASSIPVRISRVVNLDIDGFIKLATDLLDELDGAQALLPRMVPKHLLPEGMEADNNDWTWEEIITAWVKLRLESEGRMSNDKLAATFHGPQQANLGLATTRELLQELVARGDLEVVAYPSTERAHQGHIMSGTAMGLLDALNPEMLGYSTMKGHPDGD